MVECIECKNFRECQSRGELTGRLTSCPDFRQKQKTNADRIRAMTDKELARFLAYKLATENCNRLNNEVYMPTATEIEAIRNTLYCAWMQWLQQPAEGD